MKKTILANWIICPDGTMIPSFHRHDYRTHVSVDKIQRVHKEGLELKENPTPEEFLEWQRDTELVVLESRFTMNDGGTDYLRRGGVFTDMTIYDDDPFEVIRRFVCRGGRGKNNDEPLTWTPLFRMNNLWIEAVLQYNKDKNIDSKFDKFFQMELDYRFKNKIFIKEKSKIN